jgi:peptide/nickel transport system substrate-binding protein
MVTERQFFSVTNKRVRNNHNTPRWPSSDWADAWLAG